MYPLRPLLPLLLFFSLCTCDRAPSADGGTDGTTARDRPNILFILTDDQGIGDLSLHGNDSIRTPNMDRLLTEGAKFDRFYVSPVCAPTRASFLSGQYHPRTGAVFVTRRRETMDDAVRTIPEYLRPAGYRTGLFGKWHNGATKPYDPAGQGFDEFLGFSLGHFNDYFRGELENEKNEVVPFAGDLTDLLTDTALAFMLEREEPFFTMLTYQAPHTPVQVADDHWGAVKTRGLTDYNTGIYAMIESIDEQIGRLRRELEAAGKWDNTLVVFSTDNGPNGDRYRMGLKGTKGQVDEGSVRVPFAIKFPARDAAWNGQQTTRPAAHIDLLPTLLDYLDLPATGALDGRSLLPVVDRDTASVLADRPIYVFKQGYDFTGYPGSVRNEDLLVVMRGPEDFEAYDLRKDPGQTEDYMYNGAARWAVLQRTAEGMAAEYIRFVKTLGRPELVAPPIDLDAAGALPVHLLAHEGEPTAPAHFNDEYGWANDWFINLDKPGYVAWPYETAETARYRATVHYHLEGEKPVQLVFAPSTGEKFTLELAPALSTEIPVADRTRRKEVYPRAWPVSGVVEVDIPAGVGELTVYAGDAVGEDLWIKEVTLLPMDQ